MTFRSTIIALVQTASLGSSIALARATLSTDSSRSSPSTFNSGNSAYNYAPAILLDGRYRMWWFGQPPDQAVAGDHILYAESSSLDGPFTSQDGSAAFDIVFSGTGTGTFDNEPRAIRPWLESTVSTISSMAPRRTMVCPLQLVSPLALMGSIGRG
jgi:hypothetical protein